MKHFTPMMLAALALCGPCLAAEAPFIDVSIAIFEHAPAAEPSGEGPREASGAGDGIATEDIREAERRYIPMLLRYRLEDTGRFGAVRVLPVLDSGAELSITGSILDADADSLSLHIIATDSRGEVWIDDVYTGEAVSSTSAAGDTLTDDDFRAVYERIVRDLVATLDVTDTATREAIETTALLRYGHALLPENFADYLATEDDGTVRIRRLPARDDPLLTRVQAIREREYLFIDVVDEEYGRFYADVKPVYDLWREFRREQRGSMADFTARNQNQERQFSRGSYYALQESYNNYRWAKLQDLYLDELREGFANETEATEIELEDSLFRLTGTMEQQYREWRRILTEMYRLETGTAPNPSAP